MKLSTDVVKVILIKVDAPIIFFMILKVVITSILRIPAYHSKTPQKKNSTYLLMSQRDP